MKKIWKVKTKVPTCSGCVFYTKADKFCQGFHCEKRNIRAAQVDLEFLFERMNFTDWRCGDDYIFVAKPPKPPKSPKMQKTANEKNTTFRVRTRKKS